jgi:hypothetical protein
MFMRSWYAVTYPSGRVAEATAGDALGGRPAPVRTVIDIALAQIDVMWAAGGHPHDVFPTSYTGLLRITGGEATKVGAQGSRSMLRSGAARVGYSLSRR